MKNVYIYCEGQTEESFINEILQPYFLNIDIYVIPIICTTRRTSSAKYRGGISNFDKIRHELIILSKQHKNEIITTMFDYYAMPNNTPGIDNTLPDIYKRIEKIEHDIDCSLGLSNLFFGLMLHEFEGLLFSKPTAFSLVSGDEVVQQLETVKVEFSTPEHINNSQETAPSKRIYKLIPDYAKVKDGIIVAKDIGIDRFLAECKHFARWVNKIKNI